MTQLCADLGSGTAVNEVHDLLPTVTLLICVEAAAAGRDAAGFGDADHFGHHQAGTAEGFGTEVDLVEVTGNAVRGGVHVHRGDHDAVLQLQPTNAVRLEHGRGHLW